MTTEAFDLRKLKRKLLKRYSLSKAYGDYYHIRQNIQGGKLSRFINNMHYVDKNFAVCRLKLRAPLQCGF